MTSLWQSIHGFVNVDVDVAIVHQRHEVVLINDFLGNELNGEVHEFGALALLCDTSPYKHHCISQF